MENKYKKKRKRKGMGSMVVNTKVSAGPYGLLKHYKIFK